MSEEVRNDNIAVVATSAQLLQDQENRAGRISMFFRNNSPNAADIITLSFGSRAAVANSGVVLRQFDVYAEANSEGYRCFQGPIQAICATANGTLSVAERQER